MTVKVSMLCKDAIHLNALIYKTSAYCHEQVQASVLMHGQLLKTKIQARASGRPGPNAPTGDYRRSWGLEFFPSAKSPSVLVGTNKPQGRRLEYGFTGADSLGRVYNQPPYPHVAPAFDEVEKLFYKDLLKIVDKLVKGWEK